MVNLRQIIDPPAFTPSQYGLMSVLQQPPMDGSHWQNGVTYRTRCRASDTTYDECIAVTGAGHPPAPADKEGNVELTWRGATAFTVYAEFECSKVGLSEANQIATDALAQSGDYDVERSFWTGVAGGQAIVFPHLADDAEVLDGDIVMQTAASVAVTGTPDVTTALGLLEQALADCSNGQGVIHVQRKALPALFKNQLVEARGGKLFTRSGNLVAAGSGYPGTGPAGQNPTGTTSWMYATGAVFGLSGQVRILNNDREAFDKTTNTVKYIAERTYLLGWDCCHSAVQVDLTA